MPCAAAHCASAVALAPHVRLEAGQPDQAGLGFVLAPAAADRRCAAAPRARADIEELRLRVGHPKNLVLELAHRCEEETDRVAPEPADHTADHPATRRRRRGALARSRSPRRWCAPAGGRWCWPSRAAGWRRESPTPAARSCRSRPPPRTRCACSANAAAIARSSPRRRRSGPCPQPRAGLERAHGGAARRVPFVTTYHGAYGETNAAKRLYNSVMARGDVVIANSRYTADLIAAALRHADRAAWRLSTAASIRNVFAPDRDCARAGCRLARKLGRGPGRARDPAGGAPHRAGRARAS